MTENAVRLCEDGFRHPLMAKPEAAMRYRYGVQARWRYVCWECMEIRLAACVAYQAIRPRTERIAPVTKTTP